MKQPIAWIDDQHLLTIEAPFLSENLPVTLKSKQQQWSGTPIWENGVYQITFPEPLPLGEQLVLEWNQTAIPVYPRNIVRTEWFQTAFHAPDQTFGADYTPEQTSFAVWSPVATDIKLCLKDNVYAMKKDAFGVWKTSIAGDWDGAVYQYEVTIFDRTTRINDPYAKALTVNSKLGVVVDLRKTDPPHFRNVPRPAVPYEDTIIYELHVRDATIAPASGVKEKGKYKGLTETGTTTINNKKTGLDYFKQLGITHIQLLPINDFANVDEADPLKAYNWGYDPLFYQVPEGSYAATPADPASRISECKQLVQAFHQEGIGVILDVVYNHVFIRETSPFELLVPGYYFRVHEDGTPANGTGVGNDIASERPMVRKFILDTVDYWLREYRVDGFRFDLMGILDLETMKAIRRRCDQEQTPVFLLGEGWKLPTALPSDQLATVENSGKLPGISFFNDRFRDAVRGNNFEVMDTGFINGSGKNIGTMLQLVSGSCLGDLEHSMFQHPLQSVNYVECHDNHTLWDRLDATHKQTSATIRKRIHQMATGLVLLSQGIPFLHAGQEWFRTKFGDHNSYRSGDNVNQLDWEQRDENLDYIQFTKDCITLRKSSKLFRMTSRAEINKHLRQVATSFPVFGYTLLGREEDFAIYINPAATPFRIRLPAPGHWETVLSNDTGRIQVAA
ncbi:pullulanase [Evansella caseinilytica]|uniref:Pullulanase n=1 Tax=Evansella caseinilytica TaxID=1503961 RepID=A0A1H3PGC5_9BACI|nr:type I pullulanase [Evansella caseinilytica]SDY99855.1 pullulanase [Evansella caseinilytica]